MISDLQYLHTNVRREATETLKSIHYRWATEVAHLSSPLFPCISQSPLLSLFQRFQHGGESKNGSLGANCYSTRVEGEEKERKGRQDSERRERRGDGETEIKKERETPPATRANDK